MECDERFMASLAKEFDWDNIKLAPFIDLKFKDARDIENLRHDPETQRIELLAKWKEKFGDRATLWKLCEGFKKYGNQKIVDYIHKEIQCAEKEIQCAEKEIQCAEKEKMAANNTNIQDLIGRLFTKLRLNSSHSPCTSQFIESIANKFNWNIKELSPYLGLSAQDIQDDYTKIQQLKDWSRKYGSRATYHRLKWAFGEIGEIKVVQYIERAHPLGNNLLLFGFLVACVAVLVLIVLKVRLNDTSTDTIGTPSTSKYTYYSLDVRPSALTSYKYMPWNTTNCNSKKLNESDHPRLPYPLIGREESVSSVTNLLLMSNFKHIINIHGAPGFGKSALAIHVADKLFTSRCVDIRYIDTTEDHMFRPRTNLQTTSTTIDEVGDVKLEPDKSYLGPHHGTIQKQPKIELGNDGACDTKLQPRKSQPGPSRGTKDNLKAQFKKKDNMFSLLHWARSVKYHTLLILDNCDEVLHSALRDDFIELIKQIGQIQHGHVKIIVTSQEKLLLHNNFGGLEVRELDTADSKLLLTHLVPNISSHDAMELADAVGGSPLALSIIGNIINSSGLNSISQYLDELKSKPLTPLSKVSDNKHNFSVIMDTAWSYIDKATQECALYLSYFPGSFDKSSRNRVLSFLKIEQHNVANLIRHSLLQEYDCNQGYMYRLRMHRLIKEYFREREGGKNKSKFDHIFSLHFSELVLNNIVRYVSYDINMEQEYCLHIESHNIDYLSKVLGVRSSETLISNDTLHEFIALTRLFGEQLVLYSTNITKLIFSWAILEDAIIIVNETLNCTNKTHWWYKEIIEHAHRALCELKDDQTELYDESCELLQCNITALTAPLCQDIQSEVCKQVVSLNELCSTTFSNMHWHIILHMLNASYLKIVCEFITHFVILVCALVANTILCVIVIVIIDAIMEANGDEHPDSMSYVLLDSIRTIQYSIAIIATIIVFIGLYYLHYFIVY